MRSKGCASRSRMDRVVVTREVGSVEFPARFTLVAAANPCPCGFDGEYMAAVSVPTPTCPAMAINAYSILFGDFARHYVIRDVVGVRFGG